jgi:hypothetical protein
LCEYEYTKYQTGALMLGLAGSVLFLFAIVLYGNSPFNPLPLGHLCLAQAENGQLEITTKQQLLEEELKHAQRLARLSIVKQFALQDEYDDLAALAQDLLDKEYKRHDEVITSWMQKQNQSDSNSIWWRDVGRRNRDPNSSSLLLKR